ncbi:sensor histidine kinase [Saccharibacillus sp. CPCC 101409]|uniref:cache domain-containing sensor histidine kinase n=1 Tax=Saccharibacillus sp. CPCC 101409 TaxID=3058041 RepID=UPI002671D6ED|nr:sensor histidine kinase [Saccharibacillus sp. CPCC 101409]MDO3412462.1 sensor histidine kinase [Saccharibacillus sp. CPCC 101409]
MTPIEYWKRFKFRTKLILLLSAATVLISGITGLMTYRIHIALFNEEVGRQYALTAEQVLARLDSRVNDMYKVTDYITLNPSVKNAIQSQEAGISSYTQMKLEDELDDQLYQVRLDAPEIMSLRIYDLKGNRFNLGSFSGSLEQLKPDYLTAVVGGLNGTGGEYVWNPLTPGAYVQEERTNWILAGRVMNSVDLETYGFMLILFNTSLFESYVKDLRLDDDSAVYLLDAGGNLLYSFQGQKEGTLKPPFAELETGAAEVRGEDGAAWLYTKQTSDKAGLTLVSRVSLAQIQQKGRVIVEVAVFSAAASVLCLSLIIMGISGRLLRPLGGLVEAMKKVQGGRFDTRVAVETTDELGFIGESFNDMASRIDTLIHEVYERKLSEKQAELRAIQAQLNPHFLYNTLSLFFWKFYMLGDERSARLVTALSEMLQYTLQPAQKLTTLQDEMTQIRHYVEIQQARYAETLSVEIKMPPELERCEMIRLLLQPVVENVFVHAFANKRGDRRLEIRALRRGGELAAGPGEAGEAEENKRPPMLVIEIADNGCGMDEGKIARLYAPAQPPSQTEEKGREHVGLRSVMRRIELVHGSPYGVEIESAPGAGTTVRLLLPEQSEWEERLPITGKEEK